MKAAEGLVLVCQGGPRHRWTWFEDDWQERVDAAERMHGDDPGHPAAWPLGYRRDGDVLRWRSR